MNRIYQPVSGYFVGLQNDNICKENKAVVVAWFLFHGQSFCFLLQYFSLSLEPMDNVKKSLNDIHPTEYVIPQKDLKVGPLAFCEENLCNPSFCCFTTLLWCFCFDNYSESSRKSSIFTGKKTCWCFRYLAPCLLCRFGYFPRIFFCWARCLFPSILRWL